MSESFLIIIDVIDDLNNFFYLKLIFDFDSLTILTLTELIFCVFRLYIILT